MGEPKLLLCVEGQTVLNRVLAAMRAGGVTEILVVVGPGGQAVGAIAEEAGAHVLRLEQHTHDMRETCQRGLDWLEARFHPQPDDGWLLLPADHPTVRPDVIQALRETARRQPERSIFIPTYQGRRGHPAWLRWKHVDKIRAHAPGEGLNAYFRSRGEETFEMAWPGAEILRDLDTPEDFAQLLARNISIDAGPGQ
jgi:CTP:molybdopterin cytidylyltransferase MocA